MFRPNLAHSGGRVTTPNIGNNFPSNTTRAATIFPRLEEISNCGGQSPLIRCHTSATPPAATAVTREARLIACSSCMKPDCVEAGNLLHILQYLNKPFYRTSAFPGRAPDSPSPTRWICRLCRGRKHITTKSSDLRVHLRKQPHYFSENDVKAAFDPRHPDAYYEHFGPCTEEQAAKNGWLVASWSKEGLTGHTAEIRVQDVAVDLAQDEDRLSLLLESPESRDFDRRQAIFVEIGKIFAKAFSDSLYRISFEGSTLHFISRFSQPLYVAQPEQTISEGTRGIESNASNDYFNGANQRVSQSTVLPAIGTRFGDSLSNEAVNNTPGIEAFGGGGNRHAAQDENRSQVAGIMLQMMAEQVERRPSLPPTHWNNDTSVQLQEPSRHTRQQAGPATVVRGEEVSGRTFFNTDRSSHYDLAYVSSFPGGSVIEDGAVSMSDIEQYLENSYTNDWNNMD